MFLKIKIIIFYVIFFEKMLVFLKKCFYLCAFNFNVYKNGCVIQYVYMVFGNFIVDNFFIFVEK